MEVQQPELGHVLCYELYGPWCKTAKAVVIGQLEKIATWMNYIVIHIQ